MNIDLSGKIALVTGGSGNLGSVMAKTLAKCGADIVINYYKNKQRALELQKLIEELGQLCMIIQADVTRLKDVMGMKKNIEKKLGNPDIIVNNAVIQYKWADILQQKPEDFHSQFESCVMHNVYMIKAFVPAMKEKKYGRVIGINTECAIQNDISQSAYVAGKRGMDGLLRVLAKEIGAYNITVNQVAPGWTVTEADRKSGIVSKPEYENKVPLKRRGTDQEIANLVAFLASDLASFITGAFIPVCGGNVMPAI